MVGLVVITPASGFVQPGWCVPDLASTVHAMTLLPLRAVIEPCHCDLGCRALLIGMIGTAITYFALKFKSRLKIDDTLDVFACHGLGGTSVRPLGICFLPR